MSIVKDIATARRALHVRAARGLSGRTPYTLNQLAAVSAIADAEGASQAWLSERLLLDAPSVSKLVDRLVAEGLVERRQGPDRRSVRLAATAKGRRAAALLAEVLDGMERDLEVALGADALALRRTLETVLRHLCARPEEQAHVA